MQTWGSAQQWEAFCPPVWVLTRKGQVGQVPGSHSLALLPPWPTDSSLGPSVFHLQRLISGYSPAKKSSGVSRPVLQGVVVWAWPEPFIPRAQSLCFPSLQGLWGN